MNRYIQIGVNGSVTLSDGTQSVSFTLNDNIPAEVASIVSAAITELQQAGAVLVHTEDSFTPFTHFVRAYGAVEPQPYDGQTLESLMGYIPAISNVVNPSGEVELTPGEKVNLERDRRVRIGSTFAVAGYGSIRIGGDDTTIRNLQGLAFAAQLRLAQGDNTTLTPFRDEDNVIHQLAPAQVIDLWSKGAAFVESVFAAAWTLKDRPEGIPSDFTNDIYWP